MTRHSLLYPRATLAAALTLLLACVPDPSAVDARQSQNKQPVVGGQIETGWQGVGALTMEIGGFGYTGSFCTASLIAAQWLLTAAHCLDGQDGMALTADMVRFYVGPDANPVAGDQRPSNGTFYQADGLFQHPQWDTANVLNDIALVHLSESTGSLPTYTYNASTLDGSQVGESVFYVGYGVVEGINRTGGGIKRSTSIDISYVETDSYSGEYVSSGVCFGDSGGPGLYQIGGEWRIIGVNSTVGSGGSDPCRGVYNHTRVDRFASWIAGQLGQPPPSCQQDSTVCPCAAACQSNGACNNSLCETKTCREMYDCMTACSSDQGCNSDCYLQGTESARNTYNDMSMCFAERCADLTDTAWQDCADQNCRGQIDACIPQVTGSDDCGTVYDCVYACDQADTTCQAACREGGTAQAQDRLASMFSCFENNCAGITDADPWRDCIYQSCGTQIDGCFPPDNCDLRGGGCSSGQACYPMQTGSTSCFDTLGAGIGQTCTPSAETLPCDDGALCHVRTAGEDGLCVHFCYSNSDCTGSDTCQIPYFTDLDTVGACLCVDADGDGSCAADDCDDNAAQTFPGAAELCGDGADNNCDGSTDEGCSTCTDGDADGYCASVDCDDNHPGVHPSAFEKCGDRVDNNCDGQVDEDCSACTDADGDGYCESIDCDDNRSDVYPGAIEKCGDNRDNNCNSLADEGCGTCVDSDGDGYCASRDCDDQDGDVRPDAQESCSDRIDNNCDGRVNESCGSGRGSNYGDGNTGSSHTVGLCSASGEMAGALPYVLGLSLLFVRRRRRIGRLDL